MESEEHKVERALQKYTTYTTLQKTHRINTFKALAILNLHGTVDFNTNNQVFIDSQLCSKNKSKESLDQDGKFQIHL